MYGIFFFPFLLKPIAISYYSSLFSKRTYSESLFGEGIGELEGADSSDLVIVVIILLSSM